MRRDTSEKKESIENKTINESNKITRKGTKVPLYHTECILQVISIRSLYRNYSNNLKYTNYVRQLDTIRRGGRG